MTECLAARCADLAKATERLKLVSEDDALVLLKNSLNAPKLLHTLRAACCVDHELLDKFDAQLKSAVCIVSATCHSLTIMSINDC